MARKNAYGKYILSAGEIGSFTVCAEAWRLKTCGATRQAITEKARTGEKLHLSWARDNDEVLFLTRGTKTVIFLTLLMLVISQVFKVEMDSRQLNPEVVVIGLVLMSMLIVLNRITSSLVSKKQHTGLSTRNSVVSVDGGTTLPVREYISDIQGLAGRPDAVISENGYLIPVERKPLARKLRDRYVAQLLVYMRLIEEFEGKKPPYGYLILGTNCRRIRIDNTPERHAWLQKIIEEMRSILAGSVAQPDPMPKKCRKCEVRENCSFRTDISSSKPTVSLVQINGASARTL